MPPARTEIFQYPGQAVHYALDAVAGQRYLVELRSPAVPAGSQLTLQLWDAQGQYLLAVTDAPATGALRLPFTPEHSGRYELVASFLDTSGLSPVPQAFEIGASLLAADDHADLPARATRLLPGSVVQGDLELPADRDCFRLLLPPGQRVVVQLQSEGPDPLRAGYLAQLAPEGYMSAADSFAGGGDDGRAALVLTVPDSGVVDLQVGAWWPSWAGNYAVSVLPAGPDDHADQAAGASPLMPGTVVTGRSEHPGDVDVFDLVLHQGQRIGVSSTLGTTSFDSVQLSLWHTGGPVGYDSIQSGGETMLVFTAPADGHYNLGASVFRGRGVQPVDYQIEARLLGVDDHANAPGDANVLLLGQCVAGVLEVAADRDWLRVDLNAGQRYRLILQGDADLPMPNAWLTDPSGGSLAFSVPGLSTGAASLTFQPALAGSYWIGVGAQAPGASFWTSAGYQLQMMPVAADDHGDNPQTATPLPLAVPVTGQMETPDDRDDWLLAMQAGRQYILTLRQANKGAPFAWGQLLDEQGRPVDALRAWFTDADTGVGVAEWRVLAASDGPVVLQVNNGWSVMGGIYEVLAQVVPVGQELLPDRQGGLLPLSDANHLGLILNGTPAADSLTGTAADDRLRGAGGPDLLTGGGGQDLLAGGTGLDTAAYDFTLAELRIERVEDGWVVGPASGSDPADVLTGIERLRLADGGLALDVDGDAGRVARLISALFGASALEDRALVGQGLAWLDAGRSLASLTAAALGSAGFVQAAGSVDAFTQWQWICRNVEVGAGANEPSLLLNGGIGALARGESLVPLALAAMETDGNLWQISHYGLLYYGLPYLPMNAALLGT